jgi:hypothetical protein
MYCDSKYDFVKEQQTIPTQIQRRSDNEVWNFGDGQLRTLVNGKKWKWRDLGREVQSCVRGVEEIRVDSEVVKQITSHQQQQQLFWND